MWKNIKNFDRNFEKNELLKETRWIWFEDVENAINNWWLLDIVDHNNQEKYLWQKKMLVNINNYVYVVPFVKNNDWFFLKTIFPSRKDTKKYLKK